MTIVQKADQLRKHKLLATSLFILMAVVFVISTIYLKRHPLIWIGYVKAFSEAAMVGALADWFAVSALFSYPLGIKIPHTNLIENSKQKIGDNLGSFVVDNFLTSATLRPYISKLELAQFIANWLEKEKNKELLGKEISLYILSILEKLDDEFLIGVINKKGEEFLENMPLNEWVANGLEFALEKDMHQNLVQFLANKLQRYISENESMVLERVKKESGALMPGFVDNIIAKKIAGGLERYFGEIESDVQHPLRIEVSNQVKVIANDIRTKAQWKTDLDKLKDDILQRNPTDKLAEALWLNIKNSLKEGLQMEHSGVHNFINSSIDDIARTFKQDEAFVAKTNAWVQYNAYKLVMRNKHRVGELISQTVGNWKGSELSERLELEVGKDLQFIRINGTIVGGLVGILIYAASQLL